MKGELIRRVVESQHHCRVPRWWSRWANRVRVGDRWVCSDCGSMWELGWEDIVGELDAPMRVWKPVPDDSRPNCVCGQVRLSAGVDAALLHGTWHRTDGPCYVARGGQERKVAGQR